MGWVKIVSQLILKAKLLKIKRSRLFIVTRRNTLHRNRLYVQQVDGQLSFSSLDFLLVLLSWIWKRVIDIITHESFVFGLNDHHYNKNTL